MTYSSSARAAGRANSVLLRRSDGVLVGWWDGGMVGWWVASPSRGARGGNQQGRRACGLATMIKRTHGLTRPSQTSVSSG